MKRFAALLLLLSACTAQPAPVRVQAPPVIVEEPPAVHVPSARPRRLSKSDRELIRQAQEALDRVHKRLQHIDDDPSSRGDLP